MKHVSWNKGCHRIVLAFLHQINSAEEMVSDRKLISIGIYSNFQTNSGHIYGSFNFQSKTKTETLFGFSLAICLWMILQ